jgi:hypothetical protein
MVVRASISRDTLNPREAVISKLLDGRMKTQEHQADTKNDVVALVGTLRQDFDFRRTHFFHQRPRYAECASAYGNTL